MAKIMWCSNCEKEALVYNADNTHFIWNCSKDGLTTFGYELCAGPFFMSEPPELEEDWQDELVEPSVEELQEMDAGAELLLWDLGLAEK